MNTPLHFTGEPNEVNVGVHMYLSAAGDLERGSVHRTREVDASMVLLDYDADGRLLGVEMLDVVDVKRDVYEMAAERIQTAPGHTVDARELLDL